MVVADLLNSYLRYARGEGGRFSPWALLNVFSAVARPFVRVRNALFDRGVYCRLDPPLPVISVGNLCHGGTNKTPMVEMLSRELARCGLSVGIVSRGYGGATKSPLWVGQGGASSDRQVTGDEPLMLASRLPEAKVVVSRDRYEGVRLLAELGAQVAVADDAFQHRRMARDLDIVLIDATCPFGNGRLFPAGILRERQDALCRADIVILTKTEQASREKIEEIIKKLSRWIEPARIFCARVAVESWLEIRHGDVQAFEPEWGQAAPEGRFVAFSAIGNPESFYRSLVSKGMTLLDTVSYRDHHRFTWKDLDDLERRASELGATGFVCTEKDLKNMPSGPVMILPLYVPRITVSIEGGPDFWRLVTRRLRPHFVVASNGYGEDAIGAMLAERLQERFPRAEVSAFALVGSGKEYRDRGVAVFSPPSEMPSAGVVKYSVKALWKDFQSGLGGDIKRQLAAWREVGGRYRTPLCVGDVYLFIHTLWGQGVSPALVATAKSVQLSGHLMLERSLLRKRARMVWTRDEETARELARSAVPVAFCGNPIMDLALEGDIDDDPWVGVAHPHVMLLPGSRPRAYDDIVLLMDAVRLLAGHIPCGFVMVLAPTVDKERMLSSIGHVRVADDLVWVGAAQVKLYEGPLAAAAYGADLLIGLGGTANQVTAGLGVPVVSILEKGKLVQKKLLRDAEILVPATPEALAETSETLLADPVRMNAMAEAGISMLGGPGAIEAVVRYAATELGWDARCRLYELLAAAWETEEERLEPRADKKTRDRETKEGEQTWNMSKKRRGKVLRLVKIIKDGMRLQK